MSEAGTKIEIEDVLSSIRRLVSQDGAAVQGAAPVRPGFASRRPDPAVVAPLTSLQTEPEVSPVEEAECLVLTPALRVEDADGGEAISDEAQAPEDLGDELSRLETTIAQMEAAVAESGIAFEPELGDHFEAEGMPALAEATEEEAEVEAEAISEPEVEETLSFSPEEFIWARAMAGRKAPAAGPDLKVAAPRAVEGLHVLSQDDRVRTTAEEDAILEAETLHDLPVEGEEALTSEIEATAGDAQDLSVDEAEMTSDEHGDARGEAPDLMTEEAEVAVVDEPAAEEATAEEAIDLDLADAAWDEAGTSDWEAAATEEEAEAALELEAQSEIDRVEGDFEDMALELEAPEDEGLRRAQLADAGETRQKPEILRSTYETLRAEYEDAPRVAEEGGAANIFGESESAMLDEDLLRDLVAELIRQELQGRLGERITQNVRKLVRREIQRALISREFD